MSGAGGGVNIGTINMPTIDLHDTAIKIGQALKPELDRLVGNKLREMQTSDFGKKVAETV